MSLLKPAFFALWALLTPGLLPAATFTLNAGVDRTEVELGEPLRYTLTVQVDGRLDFPVQLETPTFEGFQAGGPQQSDSTSWVNGAVSETHSWTWELVPVKAGTLTLKPVHANAKSALTGEIKKETPSIKVQVRRPKNAYNPNALAPPPEAQPTPVVNLPGDDSLRDIKPDLGLPWGKLAAVIGGFTAVLGLLVWLALRRRPDEMPVEAAPADPAAHALARLDQLKQQWRPGEEAAYARDAYTILRDYFRHRLALRHEATLSEALRAARGRARSLDSDYGQDLRERLELLLFGDARFVEADRETLVEGARESINALELALRPAPVPAAAGKPDPLKAALDLAVATWRQGQARTGWMSMRAAFMRHLRTAHGKTDRASMEAFLAQAAAELPDPRLALSAGLLLAKEPPKDLDPQEVADDFLALAQALTPSTKKRE
jgi:hypothetical protein